MKLKLIAPFACICLILSIQLNAQVQGSLRFDGDDDYVEVPNNPTTAITDGDFTFEAWIQGEESAQNAHPVIFSTRESNISSGVLFFFHNVWGGSQSKMLCVQIGGNNYLLVDNGTFNASLLDNECHHVAITREDGMLSYYADGVLFGTKNSSGSVANDAPLRFGQDPLTNNTFNGLISQCRIWDVARTEAEIMATKDLVLEGTEDNLIAYWQMNEGSGQIIKDLTNEIEGQLGSTSSDDADDPVWTTDGCVEVIMTSTGDLEEATFDIYPNPATDEITIEQELVGEIEIEMLGSAGSILLRKVSQDKITGIDISQLPQGVYFVHINNSDRVYTQKVVKH